MSARFLRTLMFFVIGLGCNADDGTGDMGSHDHEPVDKPVAVNQLLNDSWQQLSDGHLDQAIGEADAAVELEPHNASAYELRGSIYIQKKLWDRAERNFVMAEHLDPTDAAFKYKLAKIKFLQQLFEEARPRFAALQTDSSLGDLAVYNVFLCDLLAGDDDRAAKDLKSLNRESGPSYYFGNAAWDLYHSDKPGADKCLAAAAEVYDRSKCDLYLSSLVDAQRISPEIVTFVTRDGVRYERVHVFVENAGLRIATDHGWVTLPFAQLSDDLSPFPQQVRQEITEHRHQTDVTSPSANTLTFTTKTGIRYQGVRWSVESEGLLILTADGWVPIPFQQLPDDLTFLSPTAQSRIATAKKGLLLDRGSNLRQLSFVTTDGKRYDGVQARLSTSGIDVLTADGWITVSSGQIPENLDPFPPEWREQIRERRFSNEKEPVETALVSFTTKAGKHYDQVRASLGRTQLRLVTSDGLVSLAFGQLPDDLSAFPESWRPTLAAAQAKSVAPSAVRNN